MRRAALIVMAALLVGAAPVVAAPQANLPAIEDEVMCPICGTLLELAQSAQADRERAFISARIAEGKSKSEIEDELVTEYGDQVLAQPEGSGFDLTAYLVPAIAFLIAAAALAAGIWRWRSDGGGDGDGAAPGPPSGEDADRLDADLARYDL
jgi:cytochrome c-type biogenesis protein CcmH